MKIIKKDFVDETTESYCAKGHRLTSGKAYFLQDIDKTIYYGGKQCAEKYGKNEIYDVPDLTKSLVAMTAGEATPNAAASGKEIQEQLKPMALSYLLLREELLTEFKLSKTSTQSISYIKLTEFYDIYKKNSELTDAQVKHVLNLESHSKNKINSKLSLRNLSTCHAYRFILKRAYFYLENNNNKVGMDYVQSLQFWLKNNCNLTSGQIGGLENFLQFLPKELKEAKLKDFG
jgi:hypothetical protein